MCPNFSAHSPQPTALSPQPSALSFKRFCIRLITSVLLFGALLSNAAAGQIACRLGMNDDNTGSRWFGSTPAATCEGFYQASPRLLVRQTLAYENARLPPYHGRVNFKCLLGSAQWVMDLLTNSPEDVFLDASLAERIVFAHETWLAINGVCDCDIGTAFSNPDGTVAGCKTAEKILTLTPAPYQNDPRPQGIEGKDGKSTFDLIAKVTENGSPKQGVAVTFTSKVEANSGGHDHHDASRPKGDVPASGITDPNGEIRLTFQAPLFAGTHTVEAVCTSCSNKTVTYALDVKVPNLTQLTGGGSGTLYKLIGDDHNHGSNHWFSYAAKAALKSLLDIFNEYDWGVVGVNDSSLIWGGCFDVSGRWGKCTSNHAGHRTGEEVDLSFYRPAGISEELRKKVYNELKKKHKIDMPSILWHENDKPNPDPTKPPLSYAHFHVYLLGQKQFNKTPY